MNTATERIEARISAEDKALLAAAANINHESISKFVVRAAREAAKEDLKDEQTMPVPAAFFDAMAASLEEPAEPIKELASAVENYHRHVKR